MPATVKPFLLRGFKGRNGGPPENIKDQEFQTLDNWFVKDGILYPREGTTRVSGLAYSTKLTGIFFFSPSYDDYQVIVGGTNAICILDGSQITALPSTSSTTIATSTRLWQGKQYKDTLYLVRPDLGVLFRCDGTQVNDAGIAAPSVAPSGTEGAAGALAAGDYVFVYTYYNSVTGAESDPSPASTVLTIAASKKINYTAIATSANAQVNARKIYRSLVGQAGEWFHVVTILDNVTTTYTGDNVVLDDMGLPAEQTNAIPPTGITGMEIHQERLWLTDGRYLYFSELGLPESFNGTSILNINADDGYTITGLVSFGEILLVMKQNAVYFISGSDEQSFSKRVLHDKNGCVSSLSTAVAENLCFWYGGDNFYMTDGSKVVAIGTTEVRDIVEDIDPTYYTRIQGMTYPKEGWYMAGIPNASGAITQWIAYNYRSGDWHTMSWHASLGAPTFLTSLPDEESAPVMYAGHEIANGHIYQFDLGADDAGYAITYSLRTKNYGFDREDMMKFLKDLQILLSTTSVATDVTVTLYKDDTVAAQMTDSFNTYANQMWKRVPLSNNGAPGNFLSVAVSYSGESNFQVMGIGFKVVDLGRQAPVL
jgi:hypothetical protein